MLKVLDDFYKGNGCLNELETELEHWSQVVSQYEESDVYRGDRYYQDALDVKEAIQEAVGQYEEYYDENGNFR